MTLPLENIMKIYQIMIRIIVIDTPYAIVRTFLGKLVVNLLAIIVLFHDRLVTNSNGDPEEVQTWTIL